MRGRLRPWWRAVAVLAAVGTVLAGSGFPPDGGGPAAAAPRTEPGPECTRVGAPPRPAVVRFVQRAAALVRLRLRRKATAPVSTPPTVTPEPSVVDPSITVLPVASGLKQPTAMAFLGPQRFLLLEKQTGRVLDIEEGHARVALDLPVNGANERGALGIAVHPRFRAHPYVYIFWTWSGVGRFGFTGSDSTALVDSRNRVDRFVWTGRTLRFDRTILILPSRTTRATVSRVRGSTQAIHNGGVLVFGHDGKLYVVTGDQAQRGQLQNVRSGAAPTRTNLTGAILRVNDDGTTPRDNPFYRAGRSLGGEAGRNIRRIFAYGIRNSYGLAVDPLTGTLWMSENGPKTFDEINRVPPGFNSRWIQVMGPDHCYKQYRGLEMKFRPDGLDYIATITPADLAPTLEQALERLYILPGSQPLEPAFSWKFTIAPTAVAFIPRSLGPEYSGNLLVGDVHGNLSRFVLDRPRQQFVFADPRLADRVADGQKREDPRERDLVVFGRDFGIVSDIKVGPEGDLYVASLSRGMVFRLVRE